MHLDFRHVARLVLALLMVLSVGCSQTPTPKPTSVEVQAASPTPKPTFTAQPAQATPATGKPTTTLSVTSAPTSVAATVAPKTSEAKATSTPISAKSLKMASPEYGMQVFVWWRPEVAERDFRIVKEAGFGWAKANFGWRDIEGAGKGQLDWTRTDRIVQQAAQAGLDLVVRIDHQPQWTGGGFPTNGPPDNIQDLADFMTAVASRYKGRIRAYEVWNEPNLAREWGDKTPDPGAYVKLLKLAYQAIKAADPAAMVISAGLSPTGTWKDISRPDDWYLESMYIAMGKTSTGYFDVLGAHGAGFKVSPETDPATVAADQQLGGHRSMCFRRVEDLRAIMVRYGDQNKQIALLEFGWTSDARPDSPYYWHRVSEEVKADYLVRAYQYAKAKWSPWIGLMSLIYISDPDWTQDNEQYWWAITDPGWPTLKPRPAYLALKSMPK